MPLVESECGRLLREAEAKLAEAVMGEADALLIAGRKEAEVERLRAALEKIEWCLAPFAGSTAIPYRQLLDIARAALVPEVK